MPPLASDPYAAYQQPDPYAAYQQPAPADSLATPGPPKPPLPMRLSASPQFSIDAKGNPAATDPATGRPIDLRGAKYGDEPSTALQGMEQIAGAGIHGKNTTTGRRLAGGVNKVISGEAQAAAPVALPAAAATMGIPAVAMGMGVGTAAQQGTEHALKSAGVAPEYSELGGNLAGIGAGATAAPLGPAVARGAANAVKNAVIPDRAPEDLMIRGLKPKSTNIGFRDSLDRSMPEINAVQRQLGKPVDSVESLLDAIPIAKKKLWNQYQQMLGPNATARVDGTPIAESIKATIPQQLRLENPEAAAAIEAQADVYRRPFTVEQLDDFLHTTNAQLDSYYAKYPGAQRKALAGDPNVAALEAKGSAIRDQLYKAMDDPGQGAAPREVMQRYGALMNLENEAHRRFNVALRQAPESLSEQISKWSAAGMTARGILRLLHGDLSGAADIGGALTQRQVAQWLKEQNTSDALIKNAFAKYQKTPAPIDMPPAFQPKGLLNRGSAPFTQGTSVPADIGKSPRGVGTPERRPSRLLPAGSAGPHDFGQPAIITPPPADTSFVRGVPAMVQPPNPARALPPATTRMTPPPDATEMFPTTTASPLVSPTGPGPGIPGVSPVAPRSRIFPAYAKGVVAKKKTIGLVGEAGPEAIVPVEQLKKTPEGRQTLASLPQVPPVERSSALPTVPERPDTLQAQMEQLSQGKRRAVMFPKGTPLQKRPKGMKSYQDGDGNTFIYHPSLTSQPEIDRAAHENRLTDLLGATHGGMGSPDKSELRGNPPVVTGKDAKGTPVQSSATDSANLKRTVEQTKKVTPKGGSIEIAPASKELERRAIDRVRGSIDVPLDDQGKAEADELGKRFAAKGGVDRVISSDLTRGKQTTAGIVRHNPKAKVSFTPNLRPWPLGGLEGKPTEQALPQLKRLVHKTPGKVPPGRGEGSTQSPQSFDQFKSRYLREVLARLNEHDRTAPDEVWDLQSHKSGIRLMKAFAKKGAPSNLNIDKHAFFGDGDKPTSVFRIQDGGRGFSEVQMTRPGKLPGGLYISRHGSTSFNAPSNSSPAVKGVS